MSRIDEDSIRAALRQESQRVSVPPPPVDGLLTATSASVRTRRRHVWAGIGAAAAVVGVAAGAAALNHAVISGAPDPAGGVQVSPSIPSPDDTSAPDQSPRPKHRTRPVAGICLPAGAGQVVTIIAAPDTPKPRCAQVTRNQSLRVVNRTGWFGARAHPIVVRFTGQPPTTLQVGEAVTLRQPFARLKPGWVYQLHLSKHQVADVWMRRHARLRDKPAEEGKVTRCSDVRLPKEGIGEADFNVDKAAGLLDINFSDWRSGKYRNISYTVRYLDDPTCRKTPEVAALLDKLNLTGR